MLKERLAANRKQLDHGVSTDLDAFNKMLRDRNIGNVIAR
jgi:hypothetical protein